MNKYKVTTFSFGQSNTFIIEAFDMVQALNSGMVNPQEVVKIEFFEAANIVDYTEQGQT